MNVRLISILILGLFIVACTEIPKSQTKQLDAIGAEKAQQTEERTAESPQSDEILESDEEQEVLEKKEELELQESEINLGRDMLEKSYPTEELLNNYDEICSNTTFSEHRNRCYQNIAMLTKNVSICSKIPDSKYDSNLDECYGAVGYVTEDVALCKNISQRIFHNECLWGIAIRTKNVSICDEMKLFVWQDACYSMLGSLTKNASLCELPQQKTYRTGCYQRLAHTLQDPSICEMIPKEDRIYVNACKRMAMKREAWRLSCDCVYSNFARHSCIYAWEQRVQGFVEKIDYELCNSLSENLHQRDWCFWDLAYVTADVSYCDDLEVDSEKNQCIRNTLIKKQNLSRCYDLNIVSDKELCIVQHAIYSKNMSLCNTLNMSDTEALARRDECIKYIGIATNNATLCLEATNREDRVRCINHVARATHDPELCNIVLQERNEAMDFEGARDQCLAGLYLMQDDWDYDCLWATDSAIAYACYYAKAEGVRDGRAAAG